MPFSLECMIFLLFLNVFILWIYYSYVKVNILFRHLTPTIGEPPYHLRKRCFSAERVMMKCLLSLRSGSSPALRGAESMLEGEESLPALRNRSPFRATAGLINAVWWLNSGPFDDEWPECVCRALSWEKCLRVCVVSEWDVIRIWWLCECVNVKDIAAWTATCQSGKLNSISKLSNWNLSSGTVLKYLGKQRP